MIYYLFNRQEILQKAKERKKKLLSLFTKYRIHKRKSKKPL